MKSAPTACVGFIFPEVARDESPAFFYAMDVQIKPICDLCVKYGNRKVFFRSKFLFWVTDTYTEMWKWMVEDHKYKDIIVPAMEETYERLCDLSISGRVGLWQTNYVNEWAARATHDNVNYDRVHQWSALQVGSSFLRALAYQAGMGARYYLIEVGGVIVKGGVASFRGHGHTVEKPFYDMIGKGVLIIPRTTDEMLSISSVAVGIKEPSAEVVAASHNSHHYSKYINDQKWVFSRLQGFWGQAPTPEYDFGYYATGRRSQAVNFLPTNQFGMIPIMWGEADIQKFKGTDKMLLTDGANWIDEKGENHTAEEYSPPDFDNAPP